MVQYEQNKVDTTQELEKKLAETGYGVGVRMSELCFFREKNAKREIKVVGILSYIKDNIWKSMFGKPADSLERATDKQDECNVAQLWRSPFCIARLPQHITACFSRSFAMVYSSAARIAASSAAAFASASAAAVALALASRCARTRRHARVTLNARPQTMHAARAPATDMSAV